ncbi:RNA polymerase I associated factor, A49-like protein [Microdochium trichocladiopsis]|uniref:RNA polymerase I associated factor, A49-like protein n=1 Tax=Microdochium trichocladiopsis TaxID=1682393 RepID=A0A9P8YIT7_9PEZI|nr:RNA polymerase I associated factor, A49-like protein [Microdochium trichocladiopsis]KAH7041045.1 RNA polymerase I associated factor, A49-like protein [Microdochium trichocladiopsis]
MGVSTEKKRKRTDDVSKSSKKSSSKTPKPSQSSQQQQSQLSTVKVASVRSVTECPPVIATTPGLCLPPSIQFQAYSKPAPAGTRKSKVLPNSLMLHSSAGEKLDYTGREEGPGGRESHLKHYIGVFDPATGKLAVMEARKMAIRGVVRAQQPDPEKENERDLSKTMYDLRTDLGHAFGTKKAKKALAAITENAISPEKAVGEGSSKLNATSLAVMQSIQQVTSGMATKEDLQAAADAAKPVPPCNMNAEEIQDVYQPEQMIGADILNSIPIKDWQDSVKKGQDIRSGNNVYVSHRLQAVASGPNAIKHLRVLRYLDCLIKFQRAAKPQGRGLFVVPHKEKLAQLLDPVPSPVVENIRRRFSNKGEMRKFEIDLVRTWTCALAAVVGNYSIETSALRYDMGVDEKEFAQYWREIGGKVKVVKGDEKGTQKQVATLSLPLEFPQLRYQRARR